ncbi:hypothetical protein EJ02DRAFT_407577 [Clathrospora elynae]|uniref:Uncharacterized protein n=1 Tax=Clathrospora elynae TaxID=706981 RepID=A0A6A5SH03_9PLEO|nr:hypothetical protein EJ02DRAFT_407577 [Clathrospora elynae]
MLSFLHKTETRRLHNNDMKKLVRIFRDVPSPNDERKKDKYRKYTKEDIQDLPRRLRSSHLSVGHTNLCSMHKGLNQDLVNDIWAWLRHELDGAVGKFKARQLEPVLQMWQSDFKTETSVPPSYASIQRKSEWAFQKDQCPACMTARIGTDEDVLFALFASMVGRFNTKTLATIDTLRSVTAWDKTRSKRLRFVRYWVKTTRGGDTTLFEAGELGMAMKRLRFEWKAEQRQLSRSHDLDPARPSLDETTAQNTPTSVKTSFRPSEETERPRPVFEAGYQDRRSGHSGNAFSAAKPDTSEPHRSQGLMPRSPRDAKVGPEPCPEYANLLSPAEPLGFNASGFRDRMSTIPSNHQAYRPEPQPEPVRSDSRGSDNTILPDDSISMVGMRAAPLWINRAFRNASSVYSMHPPPTQWRTGNRQNSVLGPAHKFYHPSIATTHTILSYTDPSSSRTARQDPLDNPVYNHIETQEERVEKYRKMLAAHPDPDPFSDEEADDDDVTVLPEPQRQYMYSAFGDGMFDGGRFDGMDEDVPKEEAGEDVRADGDEPANAAWDDLY